MVLSGKPVDSGPTDADDLMVQVQEGDMRAYQELVQMFQKKVFRVISSYHRDPQDALEVVQDTFLKMYTSRHTWERRRSFSAWLYRIAINASIDRYRREGNEKMSSLDDIGESAVLKSLPRPRTPLDRLADNERRRFLEEAVRKLPARQRDVLSLRYFAEMRLEEIAEVLQCPLGTVKSNLHKAILTLRGLLTAGKEAQRYE
jgi:RNA polymerase sigma-70 factor, ECF subfamily